MSITKPVLRSDLPKTLVTNKKTTSSPTNWKNACRLEDMNSSILWIKMFWSKNGINPLPKQLFFGTVNFGFLEKLRRTPDADYKYTLHQIVLIILSSDIIPKDVNFLNLYIYYVRIYK